MKLIYPSIGIAVCMSWAPKPAQAALAPAEPRTRSETAPLDPAADAKTLQKTLERKIVAQRLKDLGFSGQELQSKLDALSDLEIHQLATHIHTVTPRGKHAEAAGVVALAVAASMILLVRRART